MYAFLPISKPIKEYHWTKSDCFNLWGMYTLWRKGNSFKILANKISCKKKELDVEEKSFLLRVEPFTIWKMSQVYPFPVLNSEFHGKQLKSWTSECYFRSSLVTACSILNCMDTGLTYRCMDSCVSNLNHTQILDHLYYKVTQFSV